MGQISQDHFCAGAASVPGHTVLLSSASPLIDPLQPQSPTPSVDLGLATSLPKAWDHSLAMGMVLLPTELPPVGSLIIQKE